jgi:hypothetical protein
LLGQGARDGDPLPLPARESRAALANRGVVPARKGADKLVAVGDPCRLEHRLRRLLHCRLLELRRRRRGQRRRRQVTIGNVVGDGPVKQGGLLLDPGDAPEVRLGVVLHQRHAIDEHLPVLRVIQPRNQCSACRLQCRARQKKTNRYYYYFLIFFNLIFNFFFS